MYTVTGTILFHLSLQAKSTLKKDFQSQVEFGIRAMTQFSLRKRLNNDLESCTLHAWDLNGLAPFPA